MMSRRRRGCILVLAIALALATTTVQVAEPGEAEAAEYCFGSPFPTGPEQFGSCKGLLPFNFLGTFLGSIMKAAQLPIPGFAQAMLSEILGAGQDAILGEFFDTHTLFLSPTVWPLCSFQHPGENRFVGDKFVIDGLADFPLPWPIIPVFVQTNRYVGDIGDSTLQAALNNGGNLVDPGGVISQGLIAPMAKIRVGVMFGVLPLSGTAKINVNGNTISVAANTWSFWPQVLEGEIPIEWLRFPGIGPNGYCPWPAANFIKVAMGGLNAWVDWAEITIETSPPVVLVPGDQTLSFVEPFMALECRAVKFLKALAGAIPGGDVAAEFAGSLMPYDACATGARRAWAQMLGEISGDGFPVKTVDDMVQVPSKFNSDPGGWLMCDQASGGSWLPNAPLNYYLNGAAKSMGAGTIDVIAHSKGGVDLLHYMKGPWYQEAYSGHSLYIRNVATLGSPFKGTPLAAAFLTGRGGEPLPLGRRGSTGVVTTAATFWNTFWDGFFTGLLRPENFQDPSRINLVTYVLDLLMDASCVALTGVAREAVRVEQDPEIETQLTNEMLGQSWGGPEPNWVTFGANADSSGDDRLNEDCSGFWPWVLDLAAGGGTRVENCYPADDDISGGLTGRGLSLTYLVIGSYYCRTWDATNGMCMNWTEFTHNDGVVDVWSSSLSNRFNHTTLDMFSGHIGHGYGSSVGINADHFQLYQERAGTVWPMIKGKWGLPSAPRTDYP